MQVWQELLKYKWYIISIVLLCAISLCVYLFTKNSNTKSVSSSFEQVLGESVKNEQKGSECEIFVDVSGSVTRPNVYCFKQGSLVVDALKKAGGFVKGKSAQEYIKTNVNLARPLVANEKIYFPYVNELQCTSMRYELVSSKSSEKKDEKKSCVSLNEGSLGELDSLNGVGPSTAQKIIENRPYKSVEDIKNVSGIGDSLYEKILNSICL